MTYEDFPIHVEESVAVDDAQEIGEMMTREIEADGRETADLRAARERMGSGKFRSQEDVEQG